MTRVYLIRHAEAEGNIYRRAQGRYDGAVSSKGRRQIAELAERFRSIQVDALYSSDRARTFATAGAITKYHPLEIRPERRQTLALRWLVDFARNRSERTMEERLAAEIMDAANNTGNTVKRKEDVHRMAEANKAFAHFRW